MNLHLDSESKEIDFQLVEFSTDLPSGMPLAEFAKKYKTDDNLVLNPIEEKKPINWLVRSKLKDVSIYAAQDPRAKASPATISFTQDKKADNEALGISGVIGYPIKLKSLPNAAILPSLEINQLRNSQEDKTGIDSLVFRLGVDHELNRFITKTFYFGYGLQYATDTDFDLDIRGLDFNFEPILLRHGNGTYMTRGPFLIRWRGALKGEAGEIEDAGDNTALVEGEDYFRLGVDFDASIRLEKHPNTVLSFGYDYLDKVGGDLRDRKLFSVSLSHALDKEGNFTLITKYTNGDKTIALEDEESWTIGLGVRF